MILEVGHNTDVEMQPRSEIFSAGTYETWKKIGGELITLSPEDDAEFRKRMSTVGDAVMKDKPEVREMYELLKKVAARHLNG